MRLVKAAKASLPCKILQLKYWLQNQEKGGCKETSAPFSLAKFNQKIQAFKRILDLILSIRGG